MKVAVHDANIFIAIIIADILNEVFSLPYEIHTSDLVHLELTQNASQASLLTKFVTNNKLTLHSFTFEQLQQMVNEYNRDVSGLSVADCTLLSIAKKRDAYLLTGDEKLKRIAVNKYKVESHGILWLLDQLVICNKISVEKATTSLEAIEKYPIYLPEKLCTKYKTKWRKKSTKEPFLR